MIRCRNRKRRIRPEGLVLHEWLNVACEHHLLRLALEANRPIVRIARMPTPGVGVEIVHEVAASDDQDAFAPQRCEPSANLKMKCSGLSLVDAELHDRNLR